MIWEVKTGTPYPTGPQFRRNYAAPFIPDSNIAGGPKEPAFRGHCESDLTAAQSVNHENFNFL